MVTLYSPYIFKTQNTSFIKQCTLNTVVHTFNAGTGGGRCRWISGSPRPQVNPHTHTCIMHMGRKDKNEPSLLHSATVAAVSSLFTSRMFSVLLLQLKRPILLSKTTGTSFPHYYFLSGRVWKSPLTNEAGARGRSIKLAAGLP